MEMGNIIKEIKEGLDYDTFVQIIHNIPSCIFYKDKDLKYRFTTHYWEQLSCVSVVGKTDLEIRKDTENAVLAMEMDRKIIQTGKGCQYVIKSDVDGNVTYLELIKEPIFGKDGKVKGIVGLINDVTAQTLMEQRMKELTETDMLTHLLNRRTGTERIEEVLEMRSTGMALCLLDLNEFKHINDRYGHQMGDAVLREFGAAIKKSVQPEDIAMRLGGDEFMIFLTDAFSRQVVEHFVDALDKNIGRIEIEGLFEKVTASIGVQMVQVKSTFDELYAKADIVMYRAKKLSGRRYVIQEN